jgi:hypothetical protein
MADCGEPMRQTLRPTELAKGLFNCRTCRLLHGFRGDAVRMDRY